MAKSTRFLGGNEPLQIFQDDMFEAGPMTSHAPMPTVTKPPRRPLSSSSSNMILNPPSLAATSLSPHKFQSSSSPRSPLKASKGNRLSNVSMAPPSTKGVMTDSLQKKPYLSEFKTGPYKPAVDLMSSGKENMHPQIFPAPAAINLNIESYYQKPNGKRGLMEPASIRDSRPAKKTKTEETVLPPHDSFPPITDDGVKPPHSYAQLIGMAILRSPLRRLTLAQIYKWISDTYSFYHPTDAGWQNSIRHNLSLHKNFIKIERPKDDPGKGNYWAIEPGTEAQFLKEKPSRKSASAAENIPVMSTRLEPPRQAMMHHQEPMLPPPMPHSQATLPPMPTSQKMGNDLSSDATIIASDGAAPEEHGQQHVDTEVAHDTSIYSPLPAALHSSPPIARQSAARTGTPPPLGRNVNSSATRSHQRKFRSMEDSGYISSIESSALRPHQTAHLLTSEAERPRLKRGRTKDRGKGRAEEEIKLLRNSSPFGPASSSPLRHGFGQQMMPPLTPNVRFKPMLRPPPSASPNTNLRIHRDNVKEILQSPCRTDGNPADVPWSPAFHLDESTLNMDAGGMGLDFSIFADFDASNDFPGLGSIDNGSPVKRGAKRQRLDRSISTSALDDLSNNSVRRSVTSAPLLRIPEQVSLDFLETPSKAFEGMSSPSKMFQQSPLRNQSPCKFNDLPDLNISVDWNLGVGDFMLPQQDASENSGLDLSQGFERIGSGNTANKSTKKPALGRSFSTNF
ncbi:forkhead box protein L2 [Sarocladium strictum]